MHGIYEDMRTSYRKIGLSEEEINKRILCKTTKVIEGKKGLDECDELINKVESIDLLSRVADKLEERGIEPASDVEKLRVLAFGFK